MTAIFTTNEILDITRGEIVRGSRTDKPGRLVWNLNDVSQDDWFVAMSNGRENTHDLLSAACMLGAQGCLVNRRSRYSYSNPDDTLIAVSDTNLALLELTHYWCKKASKKVLTVTGTTGRKDTISLLEFLLRRDYQLHTAIERDDLGYIPDVLSMQEGTDLLLAEVSGIQRGEVARKGSFLAPDIAIITTSHHPLPFGDGTARAIATNLEILETMEISDQATAVIYEDNPVLLERASKLLDGIKPIHYSQNSLSLSRSGLHRLVEQSGISQTETKVEVSAWCALTAAVCLGFSLEKNSHIVSEVIVS